FVISYSLFVKSTGNTPPSSGIIPNASTYSIFQVDGELGLNASKNSNFNLYISGLNQIRFIDCNPQVTIVGTSSNVVDFGTITPKASDLNTVVKRVPFSVSVALNNASTGGVCSGKTLMSTFTTSNTVRNQNTILATNRTDVGFQIFAKGATTPINMNTPVTLGTVNGSVTQNTFDAGVMMLSSAPAGGDFTGIANIEITFK
ncbi:MAG: hypothetical protein QM666_10165, partial [Acinetobacter sp.]